MLDRLRARRDREQGFTLIELMVVVLIIAILVAIAIPTFLGARDKANDRAAQSNLRNALTAEKSYFTDQQAYAAHNVAAFTDSEPSLNFTATAADAVASTNTVLVSVDNTTDSTVVLATRSKSGTCYYLKDVATGTNAGTNYGRLDGACVAGVAPAGVTFSATPW